MMWDSPQNFWFCAPSAGFSLAVRRNHGNKVSLWWKFILEIRFPTGTKAQSIKTV